MTRKLGGGEQTIERVFLNVNSDSNRGSQRKDTPTGKNLTHNREKAMQKKSF